MNKTPLQQLADHGQSVWIDFLSRPLVHSGELQRLMREAAVVGITSNPTIFQKALSAGHDYDEQLREELEQTSDPKELFWRLAARDVSDACDVLMPVFDRRGAGPGRHRDGYVSI
ncbi:MAG TPA: transaldolase family protein, partial [Gammaproteobacteria bacterium]|nr:transaldolase family protein [Gammaproteobacteria bacterium]